jgi:murein DD-endopeptidase MepM/ murein hydrolase activator NlpD
LAGSRNDGGGNQVWVSDGNGFYTGYHHMGSIAVHVGDRIGRGQYIGTVGLTGNTTGSHLHFEVWIGPIWAGGYRVNPLAYF